MPQFLMISREMDAVLWFPVREQSCWEHLQQGGVIVQIWDVLQQTPPDPDVIEGDTHPSPRQRVPHVVGITQQQHACKME